MRFKLLSLTALALLVVSSHGQSPLGALEGIVTDATAAAIPGAKVTLTHLTTNAERSTVTDRAGRYAITALQVGPYRLRGYENRLLAAEDFDDDTKDAGEMGAGHVVTALYEIVPGKAEGADLRYQTRKENGGRAQSDELLFVKVRYKDPDADESRLLVEPLLDADRPIEEATANLRFAAAVAEFGMLLRGSEHKGDASFQQAARLADSARGEDVDGRRTELVFLAKTAAGLAKAKPLGTAAR